VREVAREMEFGNYRCGVYEGRYPERAGGSRALLLSYGDPEADPENELVAVATVNVAGVSELLPDDQVVVKDYSENEGMLEALVLAGVVEDTGERASFGYVSAPIAQILL
jgi:hypothetical protein